MQSTRTVARPDWGESVTLLVALALFVATRDRYTVGGPWVTLALGALLALAFRISLVTTALRRNGSLPVMMAAVGVLALGLVASLSKILYLVVYRSHDIQGERC